MKNNRQSTQPTEPPSPKSLPDQTGSESRAQIQGTTGKSSFNGQTSGSDNKDASPAETARMLKRQFQLAKRRKRWLKTAGILGAILIILGSIGTGLWLEHEPFKVATLRIVSPVVSIHVEPEMVSIPAGTFRPGNITGEDETSKPPIREVSIKKFAMGRFEVTFEEYDRFAIATDRSLPRDAGWGRGSRPVINVSWEDAVNYANWLTQQTGRRYRLPTEAEWEYVARNGGKDEIWAGTSDAEQLADYAWFNANSTGRTQPVGTKKPNGLGIKDMSGNVWEWVEDCWHGDDNDAMSDDGNCGMRLRRGGGWTDSPMSLRSSFRSGYSADTRSILIGFRLAQDID